MHALCGRALMKVSGSTPRKATDSGPTIGVSAGTPLRPERRVRVGHTHGPSAASPSAGRLVSVKIILATPERSDSVGLWRPPMASRWSQSVSAQAPRYVRNAGYAWATHTAPQPPRRVPGASQSIILATPESSDSGPVAAPERQPLVSIGVSAGTPILPEAGYA